MVLRLSFWKHFEKLWMLLVYIVVFVGLFWTLDFDWKYLSVVAIPLLVLVIPSAIIHLNHYKYCKNKELHLLDNELRIVGEDFVHRIKIEDIAKITVYMSASRYIKVGSLQTFVFEDYYYCVVETKSQHHTILSCLFSDKLDDFLEELYIVPLVKERIFYPFIN